MIIARNLKWRHIIYYTRLKLLYFVALSISVYVLHEIFDIRNLNIPFNAVATLSTALAIYLGFKNNYAYERWWEARKIWGLIVNYSRAWAREVLTMILPIGEKNKEFEHLQNRLLYRHIAFVNALRVFLRQKHDYNETNIKEIIEVKNGYGEIRKFLSQAEYDEAISKKNPPNHLIKLQGDDLKKAFENGWLSDFRFVQMSQTLTEFNNHQGMSERIKNTPLPRPYSFFSRVFVTIHGTLIPFAFIEELGWVNIPLSIVINFVFLALDYIGERTEDPFENRMDDTPLSSISLTVEENVKEMFGDIDLPVKPKSEMGVVM